jgi:hypothetical protein
VDHTGRSGNENVRVLPRYSLQARTLVLGKPLSETYRRLISKQELLQQIAPREIVDPAVEDFLLDVADDFIDSVTMFACMLAAHRNSDTLEITDVAAHLERAWDLVLPGFASQELKVCALLWGTKLECVYCQHTVEGLRRQAAVQIHCFFLRCAGI